MFQNLISAVFRDKAYFHNTGNFEVQRFAAASRGPPCQHVNNWYSYCIVFMSLYFADFIHFFYRPCWQFYKQPTISVTNTSTEGCNNKIPCCRREDRAMPL